MERQYPEQHCLRQARGPVGQIPGGHFGGRRFFSEARVFFFLKKKEAKKTFPNGLQARAPGLGVLRPTDKSLFGSFSSEKEQSS
jgi:hypothetical protein